MEAVGGQIFHLFGHGYFFKALAYGNTIQNNVLKKYKGNAVNLEIPEGVETIGQDAFWGCKQIKRVKLPSTVKVIAQEAQPIYYDLIYIAGEGGYIDGQAEQQVESGKDGLTVVAVPYDGYEFVQWSDGGT